MKQEKEVEEYKKILKREMAVFDADSKVQEPVDFSENDISAGIDSDEKIQKIAIIDKGFIEKYFGKIAQAKLGMKIVTDFEDALLMNGLAGLNCENLIFSEDVTPELFARIPFDSKTVFSQDVINRFHPDKVLENGKHFGLNFEKLNLTGKGVHVAIFDHSCNPYFINTVDESGNIISNVVEYENLIEIEEENMELMVDEYGNIVQPEIVEYKESGSDKKAKYAVTREVLPNDIEHMHGLTVSSILASKDCGVAPDSKLHFYSGNIERAVENIIKHNESSNEEDKILVFSVSKRLDDFEKYQARLSACGCELVCANNFDKNFTEYYLVNDEQNGNVKIENPLDLNNDQVETLKKEFDLFYLNKIKELREEGLNEEAEKTKEEYEKMKAKIFPKEKSEQISNKESLNNENNQINNDNKNISQLEKQLARKDNIKIPTQVTYHQVGQNGYKYQSSYSTSWGIPQVAGLLTAFKQIDRTLTFEDFCKFAKETIDENRIINVEGIYQRIMERQKFQEDKSTLNNSSKVTGKGSVSLNDLEKNYELVSATERSSKMSELIHSEIESQKEIQGKEGEEINDL